MAEGLVKAATAAISIFTAIKLFQIIPAFLQDVTERKNSEKELIKREEMFRAIISGAKAYGIFMLDTKGHILTWNEGAHKINEYTEDEVLGKHFSIFFLKKDLAAKKPQRELEIARALGQYEEEGERVRKDGTTYYAHIGITAIKDLEGNLSGFSKIVRDITPQRRFIEEMTFKTAQLERTIGERNELLRNTEAQLKLFVENGTSAIVMLDEELKVIASSRAFTLMNQLNAHITGKHLYELFPVIKESVKEQHTQCVRDGRVFKEDNYPTNTDPNRFVNYEMRPWHKADGKIGGIIISTTDVTEAVVQKRHIQEASSPGHAA